MLKNIIQKQLIASALILFACAIPSSFSFAQEARYVSDVLFVPLRSGAGNQFRIINAALRSGTKMTLLEENEDATWAKVSLGDSVEGWIPVQYLIATPTAQMKLTEANAKIAQLEQDNSQIIQKHEKIVEENNRLQNLATSQSTERDTMAKELQNIKTISRNAMMLKDNNTELLEKNQVLQTERDSLIAENEILKSDQTTGYMLYGAGLVILGVILTLLIPILVPKKGYSEWK